MTLPLQTSLLTTALPEMNPSLSHPPLMKTSTQTSEIRHQQMLAIWLYNETSCSFMIPFPLCTAFSAPVPPHNTALHSGVIYPPGRWQVLSGIPSSSLLITSRLFLEPLLLYLPPPTRLLFQNVPQYLLGCSLPPPQPLLPITSHIACFPNTDHQEWA